QARVNLEHALKRNPEDLEANIYMAVLYLAAGDKGAAAWKADEIRVLQPGFSSRRWLETHPLTDPSQKRKLVQALGELGLGATPASSSPGGFSPPWRCRCSRSRSAGISTTAPAMRWRSRMPGSPCSFPSRCSRFPAATSPTASTGAGFSARRTSRRPPALRC